MPDSPKNKEAANLKPTVSIILPTYNRAKFLPQAFDSILSQTFTDWELIIVDDGSTDNTQKLINDLTAQWHQSSLTQPVQYFYQENQGAYAARNAGLDFVRGKYVAFFDSDDIWLPHHLKDCVVALETNPDVDWVYGACRIVDYKSGHTLVQSTFYANGRSRPFLKIEKKKIGLLHVITDTNAVKCMITNGLYCGPQTSVYRSTVFSNLRFPPFRVGEDRLFVIIALKAGFRLAYFDNVHTIFHIHDAHSSLAGNCGSLKKKIQIQTELIEGYEQLQKEISLTWRETRAINQALSMQYFWYYGYSVLWQNARYKEALKMFGKGIQLWPWNIRFWRTYLICFLKYIFNNIMHRELVVKSSN